MNEKTLFTQGLSKQVFYHRYISNTLIITIIPSFSSVFICYSAGCLDIGPP